MKRSFFLMAVFYAAVIIISCSDSDNTIGEKSEDVLFADSSSYACIIESPPSLNVKEGFISKKADTIRIVRDKKTVAFVLLSEPITVSQAEDVEAWGYYQFPSISRTENGVLLVTWAMKADSHTSYGDNSYGKLISTDEGRSWQSLDKPYIFKSGVELTNGDLLQVYTPSSKEISNYNDFPKPVNALPINGYNFYYESELPNELRGVYFEICNKQNEISIIHSYLNDPGLLRYAINDMMPIVWWGNIRKLEDGSLVAGVYGTFYTNSNGNVMNWGVSFYRSVDNGKRWDIMGKIPYNSEFKGTEGFGEPTFEILKDGSLMCVMRTGNVSPMYKSFSKNNGVDWSEPEPITPNGVSPELFHLDNGVLVLVSGRPGIQVRFNIDDDGINWTEPIEMLPFMNEDGTFSAFEISCGYHSVLKVDDNMFYIVYSDFKSKNAKGEYRKSIMFRRIEIIRK